MTVPCYPDFAPVDLDLKDSLHPRLSLTADGVSEFTFSGLYLFRNRYRYRISRDGPNGGFIISGVQPGNHTHGEAVLTGQNQHAVAPIESSMPDEERPALAGCQRAGNHTHGEAVLTGQNQQAAPAAGEKFFMTPCGAPGGDVLEDLFKTHNYWKNISESVLAPARGELERRGVALAEDRDNFDYLYFRKDLAELAGKKFHKKKNLVNQFLNAYASHEERQLTAALVPQAVEILDQRSEEVV